MHGGGYFDGVGGARFDHGLGEQIENGDHGAGVQIVVVLGFEAGHVLAHATAHVVVGVADLVDTASSTLA